LALAPSFFSFHVPLGFSWLDSGGPCGGGGIFVETDCGKSVVQKEAVSM
jgi:hypothetical protein